MGYRSEVTFVFYTRKQEAVPFAALKLWFDENYPHKEATTEWEAKIETGGYAEEPEDWIMVTYQDVKWYQGYSHVDAVDRAMQNFIDTFDANDKDNVAFESIRIGEETEDIEEQRSGYSDYRLGVRREIYFD